MNTENSMVTFIRIPKNASTSLYSFFGSRNAIRNELLCADNNMYMNIFEPSHCNIVDAAKHLGEEILNNPVVAVIRNPYDRLVSMFFFAKKYNLGSIYDISTSDFDSFVRGFYRLSGERNFFHAMSQSQYISHSDSTNVTLVRFEGLGDGINRFIDDNDLSCIFDKDSLPQLNGTEHKHYSNYYSPESKEIVQDMWGCDLNQFSYSFDYEH